MSFRTSTRCEGTFTPRPASKCGPAERLGGSRVLKRSRLLAAVVFAIVATALPAKACSCALGDPRDALKASDGAFVGTLLSQTPDPDSPDQSSIYTFTVQETFKGTLDETVEVHSASNG